MKSINVWLIENDVDISKLRRKAIVDEQKDLITLQELLKGAGAKLEEALARLVQGTTRDAAITNNFESTINKGNQAGVNNGTMNSGAIANNSGMNFLGNFTKGTFSGNFGQ